MADENSPAIDSLAAGLGRVSSGLYIVTTGIGDAATGFLGSWVIQAGFEPPAVTVAVQKQRPIVDVMRECGYFCISILSPSSIQFVKHFVAGFAPGDDAFDGVETGASTSGVPYLTGAHAWLECKIVGESAWSDHAIVCGEVLGGGCGDLEEKPVVHIRKNGLSY